MEDDKPDHIPESEQESDELILSEKEIKVEDIENEIVHN